MHGLRAHAPLVLSLAKLVFSDSMATSRRGGIEYVASAETHDKKHDHWETRSADASLSWQSPTGTVSIDVLETTSGVDPVGARASDVRSSNTLFSGQSVFVHGHCRRCAVVCSWASLRRNVDPESMPGVWNEASTRAFTRQVSICSKSDILHARYDLENSVR